MTYVPLSCSGATIAVGLLGSQPARERPTLPNGQPAPRDVEAQFGQLDSYLGAKGGRTPFRRPDLILLTIGANDIGFSALVANVLVSPSQERSLLQRAGMITDIASADKILEGSLAGDFRKLRSRLHGFTGGSLDRVVYTVYGNPGEKAEGAACPGGRRGYDAHPAFAVDGGVLAQTVGFVEDKMIPRLRAYVECGTNGGCAKPAASDAMNFVDGHRQAFAQHGYCAADASVDPAFDSDCFKDGGSFRTDHTALDDPMTCARRATEFRTYASRARWVRTANDSYFAAMTYPASLPWFLQALDIHDAIWGISGVVYGGALHPTAEGHAAMADAAIVAGRKVLRVPAH